MKPTYHGLYQNTDFELLPKIDIEKLKISYSSDDANLKKVPELKHGLDKFLNGRLVFGDEGVGSLPEDVENLSEETIYLMSNYHSPENDKQLQEKS